MKVCVIGAGAIGVLLAVKLARAGPGGFGEALRPIQ